MTKYDLVILVDTVNSQYFKKKKVFYCLQQTRKKIQVVKLALAAESKFLSLLSSTPSYTSLCLPIRNCMFSLRCLSHGSYFISSLLPKPAPRSSYRIIQLTYFAKEDSYLKNRNQTIVVVRSV